MSNSLRPHGLQHTGFPFPHYLPKFAQTHVHWVWMPSILSNHLTLLSSSSAFNLFQHQCISQWLKIYWAWPCPSEQDLVFPTANPSHKEACTSLLSSSIRGQKEEQCVCVYVLFMMIKNQGENASKDRKTNHFWRQL